MNTTPELTIQEISHKIWLDRQNVIDLFCKTFLVCQEPKSPEELRALFEMIELECTLGQDMTQTFRLKLKENLHETMRTRESNTGTKKSEVNQNGRETDYLHRWNYPRYGFFYL